MFNFAVKSSLMEYTGAIQLHGMPPQLTKCSPTNISLNELLIMDI